MPGGGTDFTPLLEEAARHRPDLTVVLTDLEGPARRGHGLGAVGYLTQAAREVVDDRPRVTDLDLPATLRGAEHEASSDDPRAGHGVVRQVELAVVRAEGGGGAGHHVEHPARGDPQDPEGRQHARGGLRLPPS